MRAFGRTSVNENRIERDLHDEIQATLDLLTEEKIAAGVRPAEARRAASIELGGTESIKEQVRDARTSAGLETAITDIQYGTRVLRRNPLFTLTAALSLAIGIGATTAIFTVTNGLLLRSAVGVADPHRVVDIGELLARERSSPPTALPIGAHERSFGSFEWSAEIASPIPYGLRTLAAVFWPC